MMLNVLLASAFIVSTCLASTSTKIPLVPFVPSSYSVEIKVQDKIVNMRFRGPNTDEPTKSLAAYQLFLIIEAPQYPKKISITSEFHQESTVADVKKFAHAIICNQIASAGEPNEASRLSSLIFAHLLANGFCSLRRKGEVIDDDALVRDILFGETEQQDYLISVFFNSISFAQLPPVDDSHIYQDDFKLPITITVKDSNLSLPSAFFQFRKTMYVGNAIHCIKIFCIVKSSSASNSDWTPFYEKFSSSYGVLYSNGRSIDHSLRLNEVDLSENLTVEFGFF